jgi:hypothetical protein
MSTKILFWSLLQGTSYYLNTFKYLKFGNNILMSLPTYLFRFWYPGEIQTQVALSKVMLGPEMMLTMLTREYARLLMKTYWFECIVFVLNRRTEFLKLWELCVLNYTAVLNGLTSLRTQSNLKSPPKNEIIWMTSILSAYLFSLFVSNVCSRFNEASTETFWNRSRGLLLNVICFFMTTNPPHLSAAKGSKEIGSWKTTLFRRRSRVF